MTRQRVQELKSLLFPPVFPLPPPPPVSHGSILPLRQSKAHH